jgi:hypothetical protein
MNLTWIIFYVESLLVTKITKLFSLIFLRENYWITLQVLCFYQIIPWIYIFIFFFVLVIKSINPFDDSKCVIIILFFGIFEIGSHMVTQLYNQSLITHTILTLRIKYGIVEWKCFAPFNKQNLHTLIYVPLCIFIVKQLQKKKWNLHLTQNIYIYIYI